MSVSAEGYVSAVNFEDQIVRAFQGLGNLCCMGLL